MDTLRKALLFQVHPDYFHSIPAIKQQNEASLSVLLNLKLTRIESISVSFNAKNGKKVFDKRLSPFDFKDKGDWLRAIPRIQKAELQKGWLLAMESLCKDLNIALTDISEIEAARNAIIKKVDKPLQQQEKFSSILTAKSLDASILGKKFKKLKKDRR